MKQKMFSFFLILAVLLGLPVQRPEHAGGNKLPERYVMLTILRQDRRMTAAHGQAPTRNLQMAIGNSTCTEIQVAAGRIARTMARILRQLFNCAAD